ncbi:DUF1491 family protein [Acidisoma cladoniae]|jgi:hypothetical protein|uniref:DUF1491 family protein n=1 Tax=Acidisoma cladoniae TaxID=3040935 RepID=UPI00255020C7|nr:DUF1491 family protein [Acidisoma sp. PAMC 29798]
MEPRVKAQLWVQMALRLGDRDGRPGMVLRRGDADAGGILVVLRNRAGAVCVLSQTRTTGGDLAWMRSTGADPVEQDKADAYVARQIKIDPDLWVLEFEADDFLPPFEGKIL